MPWALISWHWVITVTMQVSVMVTLLSLTTVLGWNRLAPRGIYLLWLLVIVRVVVPWVPMSVTSLYNLLPSVVLGVIRPDLVSPVGSQGILVAAAPPGTGSLLPAVGPALVAVWLTGVGALASRLAWNQLRFWHRVRRSRRVMNADRETPRLPGLWETDLVDTPAVVGILHPQILIPMGLRKQLTPSQWDQVIHHEQAHIDRRDLIVQWVLEVVVIIYWFQPALWVARRRIHEIQEWVADTAVLSTLPAENTAQYGLTLLRVMEYRSLRSIGRPAAGLILPRGLTTRRILRIRNHKPILHHGPSTAAALIGLALMMTAMTLPPSPVLAVPSISTTITRTVSSVSTRVFTSLAAIPRHYPPQIPYTKVLVLSRARPS